MDYISIDEFIANIPNEELIILEKENPPANEIFMPFVDNPMLNAVKYTMRSNNIFVNPLTHKKTFEFPKYCSDIITNIKCADNTILLLNGKQMKCNVSNLTLPLFNMIYTKSALEVVSYNDIVYDVYLLSDTYRNKLRKKQLVNKEKLRFYAGSTYYNIF